MSDATADLREFFEQIWCDTEGYVYLPVKEGERVRKFFLQWPEKAEAVVRHVLRYAAQDGCEIFFSPALYSRMSARHEHVLGSHVAWADFDGNFPEEWPTDVAPKPHLEVQSSTPTKRHVYWKLDEFTNPKDVERINRSLAYALQADTSGWDANQFLRPPYSVNRKYQKPIVAKVVADRGEQAVYPVEAFSELPTPAEAIREEINLSDIPDIDSVKTLAKWDADLAELFNTSEKEAKSPGFDRSGALARVAYKGAELGWDDNQIYAALLDADDRWGKYKGRTTREKILIELVNRARAKVGYDPISDNALLNKLLGGADDGEDPEADLPEFLSVGQLNALPGISEWLVEGLLLPKGIGLITGRPGTGKTQLALQLAADLACGREEFLGHKLSGEPKKVMFLSLEMSSFQLQHFTARLATTYDSPLLDTNLSIYHKGEPLFLNDETAQRVMDKWMDDLLPDVVIVDSLSEATSDLSNDDTMSDFFKFLKALRHYHKAGMVFVHHHRKKANDAASRKQANSQSDIYGSFKIAASVDFALDLEDRNDPEGTLDLQLLKSRFLPRGETVKVFRDDNLHFTEATDEKFLTNMMDPKGDDSDGPNRGL